MKILTLIHNKISLKPRKLLRPLYLKYVSLFQNILKLCHIKHQRMQENYRFCFSGLKLYYLRGIERSQTLENSHILKIYMYTDFKFYLVNILHMV
jgi:hypothetical protein